MNIKPRQLEIIEATGKLLTTSGLNGLTIKNLALEMNFSESAIYRHFSSKEEIIITLLKYLNETVNKIFKESSASGDFEKDFTTLFRKLTTYFMENPFYVVAVFSEGLMNESARIGERILQLMNNLTKHVRTIIGEGQKKGLITRSLTSEQIVEIIIPAFRHQLFRWKISNFESDVAQSIESLAGSLLLLLKERTD
jgi:AcrR family transcriptional regulator